MSNVVAGSSLKPARTGKPGALTEVHNSNTVWLSNGNIVVLAGNVAFRVHKSTLALRSSVFQVIFSLPAAPDALAEDIEGCPVLHASDSSDDIGRLFKILCCGKNYYYRQDELVVVELGVLVSLIRMVHKYDFKDVLDDALSRLKKYLPKSISAWQDTAARTRYVFSSSIRDIMDVIPLVRLTNTLSCPTSLILMRVECREPLYTPH
ncbi:hypothetical protein DICSQDRAFT_110900 [Dichomitus squalens LYAD-421 SS1]|uniref:BTB domain-containing protein n=1 Tax=Dichomitus squalens (strain LYAD-421) TaxID=732165 RepID=R7SQF2_DICSQ|nr:uncharacterized protein DICSQDRAFT_110900 [Dichomitus squalens LYAD-421 SS1]EJF57995.1 hypothetical protein DICSQDRAFT_110900 [Dichomitus squalens LYAD-421 SS1]